MVCLIDEAVLDGRAARCDLVCTEDALAPRIKCIASCASGVNPFRHSLYAGDDPGQAGRAVLALSTTAKLNKPDKVGELDYSARILSSISPIIARIKATGLCYHLTADKAMICVMILI